MYIDFYGQTIFIYIALNIPSLQRANLFIMHVTKLETGVMGNFCEQEKML